MDYIFQILHPLHDIGPKIFTQSKWGPKNRIRGPKSKINYQTNFVDLEKVEGENEIKSEKFQLVWELEPLKGFFKKFHLKI